MSSQNNDQPLDSNLATTHSPHSGQFHHLKLKNVHDRTRMPKETRIGCCFSLGSENWLVTARLEGSKLKAFGPWHMCCVVCVAGESRL